ncbi:hypothetical protein NHP21005_19250 (plasmid) [Helicobacter sp. NHP21005]|nr:hypothetical protein [Helicobacter sp. NHP21005]BEG58237.1 hypothetical protein NHP21005_19250 [Helicobacter sp. NHP21005]
MLDVLKIAEQWQASSATQASTDVILHYTALKEKWGKYAPLRHKRDLQNEAFGSKNTELYGFLNPCRYDILPLCVRLMPEDAPLQAVNETLGACKTPSLDDYQAQQNKFKETLKTCWQQLEPF